MGTHAGLLDLPTELLLSIITSTDDLYKLALLSRRLNFLFLPIFLARMGISDPESSITLNRVVWTPSFSKQPFDALAGLRIAIYLTGKSVSRLNCYFQYPQLLYNRDTFQPPGTLFVAVGRLSAFIRRLASIHTVKLYLLSADRHVTIYKNYRREEPSGPSRVHGWTTAFADLLNLLNEKGCKSLSVQYESNDRESHMHSFHVKGAASAFFSLAKNTILPRRFNPSARRSLSGTRWKYSAAPHSPDIQRLSPAAINNTVLTTLFIHSSVLLTPPFHSWTLDILEYSPQLTSLSISHISFSDGRHATDIWRSVLIQIANVASSKITEFSIFHPCPNLDERDLLAFISRLERLVKLTIVNPYFPDLAHDTCGPLRRHLTPAVYPTPHLKHLQTLEAPEKIVQHFLRARPRSRISSRPAPLPQLQHLVVSPTSIFGDPLFHTSPNKDWNILLQQLEHPRRSTPITFGVNIRAGIHLSHTYMASHLEWRETNTSGENVDNFIFHRISEVTLHSQQGIDPRDGHDVLCQWLAALFPDLRLVNFTYYTMMLPETMEALMEALDEHCPMVDRLVVPGGNFTKHSHIWQRSKP